MSRKNIIAVSVLSLSFLISLTMFLTNDNRYSRLKFKFKYELEDRYVLEDRFVILKGDRAMRVETVVKELFTGPMSVFNQKIVPYDFTYNKLVLNKKNLYLDLPLTLISYVNDNNLDIDEILNLIRENILMNSGFLTDVIITVNGTQVGEGPSLRELPQTLSE